jgi:hypothetical protein
MRSTTIEEKKPTQSDKAGYSDDEWCELHRGSIEVRMNFLQKIRVKSGLKNP